MRIATGAGHGGNDPGAVHGNDREVDYNRKMNAAFIKALKKHKVTYKDITVNEGYPGSVTKPALMANAWKADLAIQHHFNAGKGEGIEVLCYNAANAKKYATPICKAVSKAVGLKNRGAKIRTDLGFINTTTMPALIIEWEFIDEAHDNDSNLVDNYADKAVLAVLTALGVATTKPKICPTCKRPL